MTHRPTTDLRHRPLWSGLRLLLLGPLLALGLAAPPAAAGAEQSPEPQPEQPAEQAATTDEEAPEELVLVRIPPPDLGALEPAVAEQIEATQEALEKLLIAENPPARAELAQAFGELGRLFHAYELVDSALAAYVNAHRLAPDAYLWPHLAGHLLASAGRAEEAAWWQRQALARATTPQEALPALVPVAEYLRTVDRLDDAERLLDQAEQIAPGAPSVRAERGQIALSRRNWPRAIDELEAALAAVPQATRLHHSLGLAYRGAGDLDKAREHLEQRGEIGLKPPDPWLDELAELRQGERVQILQGRMAYRAGDLEAAEAAFRRAVEAAPESPAALVNLGTTLAARGATDAAIAQFRTALEVAPDNQTARFNLGSLLADQDSASALDEARTLLSTVVEARPGDAPARRELADVLARLGELDEAVSLYRRAVGIDPYDELAWMGEVDIHVVRSDYAEALERLDNAAALLPRSGLVAHARARLLAGSPRAELRDGEEALELAVRVFEAQKTIDHAATVAMALAELGRCEEAAEWQRQAVTAAREGDLPTDQLAAFVATLARYEAGAPCRPPVASAE